MTAKAEDATVEYPAMTGRSSAEAAIGAARRASGFDPKRSFASLGGMHSQISKKAKYFCWSRVNDNVGAEFNRQQYRVFLPDQII
jgi:hypothetical protein